MLFSKRKEARPTREETSDVENISAALAWRRELFRKNRSYFESTAAGQESVDWLSPIVQPGACVLGPLDNALTCLVAGATDLAEALGRAAATSARDSWAAIGADSTRDQIYIDRPIIALAARAGRVLFPTEDWPTLRIPFDAFETFVAQRDLQRDDIVAIRLIWSALARLEQPSELTRAQRGLRGTPRFLESEWGFVNLAPEAPTGSVISAVEGLLMRWRDPAFLMADTAAANHVQPVTYSLALLRAHLLAKVERATLMVGLVGDVPPHLLPGASEHFLRRVG